MPLSNTAASFKGSFFGIFQIIYFFLGHAFITCFELEDFYLAYMQFFILFF